MKAVYVFLAMSVMGLGASLGSGYVKMGNKAFQVLVTDVLYLLTGLSFVIALLWLTAEIRRRRSGRGFMTIRQYYMYKSAR